jgi:hypothetical protein
MLSLAAAPAFAGPAPAPAVGAALSRAGVPDAAGGLASPYGEVAHFGGYGGTPGKFVVPTGFAVEPENPSTHEQNAVYVLDQTFNEPAEGKLDYRLQKLSSSGTVLGSTAVSEKYTDERHYTDAHPLVSLAVDAAQKRVYAIVEGIVDSGEGDYVAVAQELVAWSTKPNAKGELVPAAGTYASDPITNAALITGSLEKGSAAEDLFAPEGLAIASNHDAVIEAQHGVNEAIGGPTILQQVVTEGTSSGQLGGDWIAPYGEQAGGIFPTTEGSSQGFGVDLYQSWGAISRMVDVSANLTSETPIAPDSSGGVNRDEAPSIDNNNTPNSNSNEGGATGRGALGIYTAASPITQLTNGVYAARYGHAVEAGTLDLQSAIEPWDGVPYFWTQGLGASGVANEGVRLFAANGTVLTTIGGQAQGQACNLDFGQLSVAAGANGALFALTQPNTENNNEGDEVIEFAPGGKGACPQPSGSLTVNGKSGSSFSFPVGTPVTFADSVEREGGAPYRFDWVLLNSSTLAVEDLKTQIEAPAYEWPAPSTTHTFEKTGTYYVAATVYGDYGLTYITTDTITIHH